MADPEQVAEALRRGVELLRAGRPEPAFDALDAVVSDPGFRDAPDLADIAARVWSLRGQAAFQAQRFDEAETSVREALRRVRELGDTEGIAEVTDLLALVTERRQRRNGPADAVRDRLRAAALADVVAIRDPVARTEALLRKCQSSLEDADRPTVLAAAELAWREGSSRGDQRAQVLARLCAAHADPEHAADHLAEAVHSVSTGGSEIHSLVGAIARTATLLGVTLPAQVGPELRTVSEGTP